MLDSQYPLVQLQASKSSINDLFKELLDDRKGLEYQITVKCLLSKQRK